MGALATTLARGAARPRLRVRGGVRPRHHGFRPLASASWVLSGGQIPPRCVAHTRKNARPRDARLRELSLWCTTLWDVRTRLHELEPTRGYPVHRLGLSSPCRESVPMV